MLRFLSILNARNKEFLRDRASLAWNILFPLFVIIGFSLAFSGPSQPLYKIAIHGQQNVFPGSIAEHFLKLKNIQFFPTQEISDAVKKLQHHQYDMLIDFIPEASGPSHYWINSTAPKGYIAEKLLIGTGNGSLESKMFIKDSVEGSEIRYVDWLIAGLLGMNMMFSALFGVGYVLVRYRKNGVLRRFKATPISAFEFLSAQVISRFMLIILVSSVVYIGCHFIIHFQMVGSYLNLFLVFALGALCLISLGLLVACRVRSEELANGILNLLTWPMMFFSGVWFSLEGTHPFFQKAAKVFPLTHVIEAARAVMLEDASLSAIAPNLGVLLGLTVLFLSASSFLFRWD